MQEEKNLQMIPNKECLNVLYRNITTFKNIKKIHPLKQESIFFFNFLSNVGDCVRAISRSFDWFSAGGSREQTLNIVPTKG